MIMKIRKAAAITAATAAVAGGGAALAATAASAATVAAPAVLTAYHSPVKEAFGSVELGNPLQDAQFAAFQNGRYHGAIDYTNFTYAEPGSGVWAPVNQPDALTFTYQGTQYTHTLNGGLKLTAISPERLKFSGTGVYTGQTGATWTIAGHLQGSKVSFVITYNGTLEPGYTVTATGTIASDGSASGTAASSAGQTLAWTLPAGSFQSVLHYVAPIKSARVDVRDRNATFNFTIPNGSLAGTKVTVTVHGGAHPTWEHGVTGDALTAYPVEAGSIYVP
jgi:hypothetical protein